MYARTDLLAAGKDIVDQTLFDLPLRDVLRQVMKLGSRVISVENCIARILSPC
jgi:hypothetical protein